MHLWPANGINKNFIGFTLSSMSQYWTQTRANESVSDSFGFSNGKLIINSTEIVITMICCWLLTHYHTYWIKSIKCYNCKFQVKKPSSCSLARSHSNFNSYHVFKVCVSFYVQGSNIVCILPFRNILSWWGNYRIWSISFFIFYPSILKSTEWHEISISFCLELSLSHSLALPPSKNNSIEAIRTMFNNHLLSAIHIMSMRWILTGVLVSALMQYV